MYFTRPPEVHLVTEHGLWEPGESFSTSAQPTTISGEELDLSDLVPLHTQFYIDKALLARRIESLLEIRSQVTLAARERAG